MLFITSSILGVLYYDRWKKYNALSEQKEDELRDARNLISKLRHENKEKTLSEWLEAVKHLTYRNEIEVEIKFIYPLLKHLGYQDREFNIRVLVKIQVGRTRNRGEADWVIWKNNTTKQRQAHIVIEAKAPSQSLDSQVKAQARSYAFALDAPIYVITNGKRMQIFQRGIRDDHCVVNCNINELSRKWEVIQKTLQKPEQARKKHSRSKRLESLSEIEIR